jgi:uncharacterized membrane protein YesL
MGMTDYLCIFSEEEEKSMAKIFDLDSPLMRFLSKMADLMILNVITIVGCIPVITAGASITGMHYVLLKMARGEEAYIVKDWWKSFKQNFRQATIIWVFFLAVFVLLAFDYRIYTRSGIDFPKVLMILTGVAGIIVFIVYLYIFPILARFSNSIRNTVKNSFFMSIIAFPKTICMAIITAAPMIVLFVAPATVFKLFPLYIMFVFSLPAYACALLYSPVFARFEPKEEKKENPSEELSDEEYEEVSDILKSEDVVDKGTDKE